MSRFPRISLRTLLIGINLVVLVLPLAGIQLMRLYESALVRQTESALIAQAAFVAAFYRSLLNEEAPRTWPIASRPLRIQAADNTPLIEGRWLPHPPELDLATSPSLPGFPDGLDAEMANPVALAVGARLMPVLKDAQLVTLASIRVVDPWGVIVASTGDDVGLSIDHGEEIRLALTGRATSRLRRKTDVIIDSPFDSVSRTSRIRVFVASPILLHDRLVGAVLLSRTPPSIVQALYAKRWLLLQALLLLVGLVLVMSLLTFRLIARPIGRLAEQASQIARGELRAVDTQSSPESTKPRTLEIARLQEAITDMATTLERRANYLQDFSRHVSHEFKTPIAGIRGAVEVLQDHGDEMSDARRERFLANIAADAQRLYRLTGRLMELTKAELGVNRIQPFVLEPVISAVATSVDPTRVRITAEGIEHTPALLGSPAVLQAVLETLVENALQHEAQEIHLTTSCSDEVVLTVTDTGNGISRGNRTRVFEPFFTTQRDQGGTGLGLTIAQTLLQQVGARLTLHDAEKGVGASFQIHLPIA